MVRFPDTGLMSNAFAKDVGWSSASGKTLQKAKLYMVRVSLLFLVTEFLKVAIAAARWTKRTEFRRTISGNPRVRNDE